MSSRFVGERARVTDFEMDSRDVGARAVDYVRAREDAVGARTRGRRDGDALEDGEEKYFLAQTSAAKTTAPTETRARGASSSIATVRTDVERFL